MLALTLFLSYNIVDFNNLQPLIFPGALCISSLSKDSIKEKKYSLCKDEGIENKTSIAMSNSLLAMFTAINVYTIYKMVEYYGSNSADLAMMSGLSMALLLEKRISKKKAERENKIIEIMELKNQGNEELNNDIKLKEYISEKEYDEDKKYEKR